MESYLLDFYEATPIEDLPKKGQFANVEVLRAGAWRLPAHHSESQVNGCDTSRNTLVPLIWGFKMPLRSISGH